jgi:Fic family protein
MPGRYLKRTWQYDPGIHAPAKYKRACRYDPFVPEALSTLRISLDGGVAGVVSEAEQAIRSLNDGSQPALAPLARLLLRTESIASSRIEGIQMGVRELARAEAKLDSGQKTSQTALDVLANVDAMLLAIDDAATASKFGIAQITAIHKRLMERAENKRVAGNIRTRQNWIGGNDYNPCGADFVPPPPEDVTRLLVDLCRAINDDRLPPLVQAALVHAQFETIHPFEDGNGRTGRALIQVVLRRRGIAPSYVPPVSIVLADAKKRYISGLTAYRGDGVSEWIGYFAAASARAAELGRKYLMAIAQLRDRWRAQLAALQSAPRADAAAWSVIDILPANPMISSATATAATGRARSQIYQAIEQLQAAGVLVPLSQSRRNQSWEAVGLLELIEGMEAGERMKKTTTP